MRKKVFTPEIAFRNLEFLNSHEARTVRILCEYFDPEARLQKLKVNNTVLFLGSSKADPDDKKSPLNKYYWEAEDLAYHLVKWAIKLKPKGKNFVICTGGGPGIMEAANRGAARAGGKSIGMNISIPSEQYPNPHISPELSFIFHYFFMRKFWLVYKAKAVVAFPGGFGTLDEVFETLTLLQSKKMEKGDIPIILYGEEYWRKIINFDALLEYGNILPEDLKLFSFYSKPEDVLSYLKKRLLEYLMEAD